MADEGAAAAAADSQGAEPGNDQNATDEGGDKSYTFSKRMLPADLAANAHFKGYIGEDGKFNVDTALKDYAALKDSQPVVPDEYAFDYPDDYPVDESDVKAQREMARELGLTQAQYEAIAKYDVQRVERVTEQLVKEREAAKAALTKEWGQEFDARLKQAAKTAEVIFGADLVGRHDLGNDPQFLRGLYLISTKLSEDSLKLGGGGAAHDRPTGPDGTPRLKFPSMGD